MKIFLHTLITIVTLVLGSVASADEKPLVITGRVVALSDQNITVQGGKKRLEIICGNDVKYTQKPTVGDTVRVYYTMPAHSRFDPDGYATKIEVIAAGSSKK
jgi:hypothetical protein